MAGNYEIIRAPYNAEEPLKSLIKMLNKCAEFSTAAVEPVLETQIVRIKNGMVDETGQ